MSEPSKAADYELIREALLNVACEYHATPHPGCESCEHFTELQATLSRIEERDRERPGPLPNCLCEASFWNLRCCEYTGCCCRDDR